MHFPCHGSGWPRRTRLQWKGTNPDTEPARPTPKTRCADRRTRRLTGITHLTTMSHGDERQCRRRVRVHGGDRRVRRFGRLQRDYGCPDPATALQVLGRLLPACRAEPRIPLTRTGLNHGPVLRRSNDLFGSTVNIAARVAALASPGQLLATQSVADIAIASGIVARDLGTVALRSISDHVPLYSIELAPAFDPAWIDPVCKMHAPYEAYRRTMPTGPWFCSERCAEAYRRSPEVYPIKSKAQERPEI